MKRTKDIENIYGITRQTLNNWMLHGDIERPKRNSKEGYCWNDKNEEQIQLMIKNKNEGRSIKNIKSKSEKLKITNRRYLGNKQKLLNFIDEIIEKNTKDVNIVADIFGGTGSVADMFRRKGKKVIVNDILNSNYISFLTWFGNEKVDYSKIENLLAELNSIEATEDNYVSNNFGNKYFTMENARKIGAIREKIEGYNDINKREKAFLLTSLLYAMDKVANTVGHYDAYRAKMDSLMPIYLRAPELNYNIDNEIYKEDANILVKKIKADLVYIDTPYNSRQYGDAYHLLENIIDWKKPEVTGVAMKMIDRKHLKSDYCTTKAVSAFEELIENIDSKYIVVSYNNMAQKGTGRSNAKISNEEIIDILKRKGTVTVFDTDFNVFTTGKTKIDGHKEILYLCKVKKIKKSEIIVKSPLNYTGGKYKLLQQLTPLFPPKFENFIDLFAGGANVGVNVATNNLVYLNDVEKHIIELYELFSRIKYEKLLEKIEDIIENYGLSNTKKFGYEYYNSNSSIGVAKFNKEPYSKLREDYNQGKFKGDDKSIVFYVLTVFAFNNQIRFNNKGEYNLPTGKRDFNSKMEEKLFKFHNTLKNGNFKFSNLDFRNFKEIGVNDFIYADPPYRITIASYNENTRWSLKDDLDLFKYLDNLNEKGIKFALSNVIEHKGNKNKELIEWAKKYKIHYLNFNYNNSNYQSKAKESVTKEVLVTNY